jgi:hypothetical protein
VSWIAFWNASRNVLWGDLGTAARYTVGKYFKQESTTRGQQKEGSMYGVPTPTRYFEARTKGRRAALWSKLTGRSRRLLSLDAIDAARVCDRHSAGLRAVPIERIRGSEGRSEDFDCAFYPIQTHSRERWMNVARARDKETALPPVDLIQVGELYFVRDGHHRISVARILGERYIEAEVTIWQVDGPLPWEQAAAASGDTSQAKGITRLSGQLRAHLAGLRQYALLGLRSV